MNNWREIEEIDDFKEDEDWPKKQPPGPLDRRPSPGSALSGGLHLLIMLGLSRLYWTEGMTDLAANRVSVFEDQEYWRLLTTMYVHGDTAHLLANAPLFLLFSFLLRDYFGGWLFPHLTLLAGILTTATTLWFYPDKTYLVGASGVVFAMVSMWLILYLRFHKRHTAIQKAMRVMAFILVVMFPTQFEPTTSYLAHGLGFVYGIVITVLFGHLIKPRQVGMQIVMPDDPADPIVYH